MFRFEHSFYLYTLLIIPPLLIFLYAMWYTWRSQILKNLGNNRVKFALIQFAPKKIAEHINFILLLICSILIIIGLANFQMNDGTEEVQQSGFDIMVAVDISNSMLAQDISPNRLERTKQLLSKLLTELAGNRIGLIVFAGHAYIQSPFTSDYGALSTLIQSFSPNIISRQGSAVGEAIELSINAFERGKESTKSKAIVIISDGETHDDEPEELAKKANEKGIHIYTMGIGTKQGGKIPEYNEYGKLIGYKTDEYNNVVVSKLNESTLKAVAAAANGAYIPINETTVSSKSITYELNKLEKTNFGIQNIAAFNSYFQWFLAPALFLLGAYFLFPYFTQKKYFS